MKKHLLNCNVFKSSGHNVSEIFLELQQKSLQRIQAEQAYLTFSKERADDLLAKMMFTSGASFTLLENPYFKEFVECLNPQYAPFRRRHLVENLMYDYLAVAEAAMMEKIGNVQNVSISIDGWSFNFNTVS